MSEKIPTRKDLEQSIVYFAGNECSLRLAINAAFDHLLNLAAAGTGVSNTISAAPPLAISVEQLAQRMYEQPANVLRGPWSGLSRGIQWAWVEKAQAALNVLNATPLREISKGVWTSDNRPQRVDDKRMQEILNRSAAPAVSTPRCPKCGSSDIELTNPERRPYPVCNGCGYMPEIFKFEDLAQFFQPAPSPPQTQLDMSICNCGHAKAGHISGVGYCTACDCGEFKL